MRMARLNFLSEDDDELPDLSTLLGSYPRTSSPGKRTPLPQKSEREKHEYGDGDGLGGCVPAKTRVDLLHQKLERNGESVLVTKSGRGRRRRSNDEDSSLPNAQHGHGTSHLCSPRSSSPGKAKANANAGKHRPIISHGIIPLGTGSASADDDDDDNTRAYSSSSSSGLNNRSDFPRGGDSRTSSSSSSSSGTDNALLLLPLYKLQQIFSSPCSSQEVGTRDHSDGTTRCAAGAKVEVDQAQAQQSATSIDDVVPSERLSSRGLDDAARVSAARKENGGEIWAARKDVHVLHREPGALRRL